MAKMIPERPDESTSSLAEIKLFKILRDMPDSDSWIVLHSLAIANHTKQSQGEADFLVVIPEKGTFVLEIKGGGISCDNGVWYSVDRYDEKYIIKNPIIEANEAMHSIINYVSQNEEFCGLSRSLSQSLFGFGVVFPNCTFHGCFSSLELAEEQIADYDDCLTSSSMKAYLYKLASFWKKRYENRKSSPDIQMAKTLANLLRPKYIPRISINSIMNAVENQVIQLTENQQDTFCTISENKRCLIKGGAGTGKTVIALHFANEKARDDINIGFFCYNTQLAEYINENLGPSSQISCDSFTEYMLTTVRENGVPIEIPQNHSERNEFYKHTLPTLFMDSFVELEREPFDVIIVDEAQDLMLPQYLEAIDLVLKDGLKGGSWYFFMDVDRQKIYDHGQGISVDELGKDYFFTIATLRDNCRNSVAIIETVDKIFGLNTRHKKQDERGMDVSIRYYKRTSEQAKKLLDILFELEKMNVPKENIVILSPLKFDNSVVSTLDNDVITCLKSERKRKVFFSTIHSFKGLESSIVILVDIERLSYDEKKDLLYVGMTRAKSLLYVLADEKSSKFIGK